VGFGRGGGSVSSYKQEQNSLEKRTIESQMGKAPSKGAESRKLIEICRECLGGSMGMYTEKGTSPISDRDETKWKASVGKC